MDGRKTGRRGKPKVAGCKTAALMLIVNVVSVSSGSAASIDAAYGQHWYRHRQHPSMRHLASIGIVIVGDPRGGACLDTAGGGVSIGGFHTAVGVGHGGTARCCLRSVAVASRRRGAVLAHLGSVDAAKSTSLVARRVASLSRRRDAAVRYRALEGPRPLSICREAGQGVPLVYLPGLCRRSARACGVAASTAVQHIVGGNPSRQGEHVHHGGQQMC